MHRQHEALPRLTVALLLATSLGCEGDPVTFIDARRDLGAVADVGPDGGGAGDMGSPDQGGGPDCPPVPTPYTPLDTMGPPGESRGACEARRPGESSDVLPMGQAYVAHALAASTLPVTLSCGQSNGAGDYAALRPRLNCGQRLRVVNAARTSCHVVEVLGTGPHICLEETAGDAVAELSPEVALSVLQDAAVAASDGVRVFVAPIGSANPLGSCDHLDTPAAALAGFIGGPCNVDADCSFTGARCDTAGFPGGHCTRDCTTSCPDAPGPNAFTACAAPDGDAFCHARCDFTLFATGCRDGYGCVTEPNPAGGAERDVCVPVSCS